METKPISNRLYSLLVLYDMHTDFFGRALKDITDADAQKRLDTKANHVAWITGSLVQERCELAKALGKDVKQQADELFKDHKGIQEGVTYPPLEQFSKDWAVVSPVLREALMQATDAWLDDTFEMMPGEKMSYFDWVTFQTYREANCIGQIALWRRLLGYNALNYM